MTISLSFRLKCLYFHYLKSVYEFYAQGRRKMDSISMEIGKQRAFIQKQQVWELLKRQAQAKTLLLTDFSLYKAKKTQERLFNAWRSTTKGTLQNKQKYAHLLGYLSQKRALVCFDQWIQRLNEKRKKRAFLVVFRLKKLRKWFDFWLGKKAKKLGFSAFEDRKKALMVRKAFQCLKLRSKSKKDQKGLLNTIRKRFLMRKFMGIIAQTCKNIRKIREFVRKQHLVSINKAFSPGKSEK